MYSVPFDDIDKIARQMRRWNNCCKSKVLFDKLEHRQKKLLENNKKFKDMYKGRRCFILGNAPSVNKLDFDRLHDELVITVNDMFFHNDFDKLNSNFHFFADPAYFNLSRNDQVGNQIIQQVKGISKNTNIFLPLYAMDIAKKYGWRRNINISYFLQGLFFYDDYQERIDFAKSIPSFQCVIHYCIAFAVYTGCDEICLLGCDMTNLASDFSALVNESTDQNYGYEMSEEYINYVNRLTKDIGLEYLLYGYWKIVRGFAEMYKYCIRNNVKMYNCSEESMLQSIPKKKLEDIISKDC